MPSLAQMAANSATVTFSWQGLDFTVAYFPGKLSDAAIAQIDAALDSMNTEIVGLVQSWNVTENDGTTPFPLDAARLVELPVPFKQALVRAMIRDNRPN